MTTITPLNLTGEVLTADEAEALGHSRAGAGDDRRPIAKGMRDSRYLMVTGRQVHCPKKPHPWTNGQLDRALALSMLRQSRFDIAPELITVSRWQQTQDIPKIVTFCLNYLHAWCAYVGNGASPAMRAAAVNEAILAWLHERVAVAKMIRRRLDRQDKHGHGLLCTVTHSMLQEKTNDAKYTLAALIFTNAEQNEFDAKIVYRQIKKLPDYLRSAIREYVREHISAVIPPHRQAASLQR